MGESIENYKIRIRSYLENNDPLHLQRAMPAKLDDVLKDINEEKLSSRPAPGKWSIREIVAHLADDELVGAYRIRMILSAPGTDIQAFDQDLWAKLGKYDLVPIARSLSLFTLLREANLALFETLSPEQWEYYGIHAERGKETIRDIATYYAGHDINHLKQIESILGV